MTSKSLYRMCRKHKSTVLMLVAIITATIAVITYTRSSGDTSNVESVASVKYNELIAEWKHALKVHTEKPDITDVFARFEDRRNVVEMKPAITDVFARFEDRRNVVEMICDKHRTISGITRRVITNKQHNISVCMVPKAGITIWTRLFKFLQGQKRSTGNPMSISKYEVHYKDLHYYADIVNPDPPFIAKSLKVMTVRNPYTRLLSAYIDKFVLPDFWQYKGKEVIRMTRTNAPASALTCGKDVTFAEFIQYVVTNGHAFKDDIKYDCHWMPASDVCDPCILKPSLISTQETFMSDFRFVMNEINLLPLLSNMTLADPVDYEIQDEIKYNFEIAELHSNCTDIVGICERIWQAFVLNGYIPPTEKFPSETINYKVTWNKMYQIIKFVRTRNNITKQDTNRLRKQALTDAYARIPEEHLHALQKLYELDFQLFGYDSNLSTLIN